MISPDEAEFGSSSGGGGDGCAPLPDRQCITIDGRTVSYRTAGNPRATILGICNHGVYSSSSILQFLDDDARMHDMFIVGPDGPGIAQSDMYEPQTVWEQAQDGLAVFRKYRDERRRAYTFALGFSGGVPAAFAQSCQEDIDLVAGVSGVSNMGNPWNLLRMNAREQIGILLANVAPRALEMLYQYVDTDATRYVHDFEGLLRDAVERNAEVVEKAPALKASFEEDYHATHRKGKGPQILRTCIQLLSRWGFAIREKLSRRKKVLLWHDARDPYVLPSNLEWYEQEVADHDGMIELLDGSGHQTLPVHHRHILESIHRVLTTGTMPEPTDSRVQEATASAMFPRRIRLPLRTQVQPGGTG